MTKLEIPEGDFYTPWEKFDVAENLYITIRERDGSMVCQIPRVCPKHTVELLFNSPAMAEEIKRLREENGNLLESLKFYQELSDERNGLLLMRKNQLLALEAEIEALRRSPATREDRIWQCYTALLASALKSTKDVDVHVADAILAADRMLAALAKPLGAQEPEKAELPDGCEPFDLERAKVEGARTKRGSLWSFKRAERDENSEFWAIFECGQDWFYYRKDGIAYGTPPDSDHHQLYCIKEAK